MANGAYELGDYRCHFVEIKCDECQRYGCFSIARLIEQYGSNANMPGLLFKLAADCPRTRTDTIWDRCRVRYHSPTIDQLKRKPR